MPKKEQKSSVEKPLIDVEVLDKTPKRKSTKSKSKSRKNSDKSNEVITMKHDFVRKESEDEFEHILLPNTKSAYATNTTVGSLCLLDGEIEENAN